jgi:hypothetical protein
MPASILSDRGQNFMSKLVSVLYDLNNWNYNINVDENAFDSVGCSRMTFTKKVKTATVKF